MKTLLGLAICVSVFLVLPGCSGPYPTPPPTTGTSGSLLYYQVGFVAQDNLFHLDKTSPTPYYTFGSFTQSTPGLPTQTYNGAQAYPGTTVQAGQYRFLTTNTLSTSSYLDVQWVNSHDGDLECPKSLNGNQFSGLVRYTYAGQYFTQNCNVAQSYFLNPSYVNLLLPPSTWTMEVPTPLDVSNGLPTMEYSDMTGNVVASEQALAVSTDGLTVSMPVSAVLSIGEGDFIVNALIPDGNDGFTSAGGAIVTVMSYDEPDTGGGDPGCDGGVCEPPDGE